MRMKERFHTQGPRVGLPFTPKELESQQAWEDMEDEMERKQRDSLICDYYMRPINTGDEVMFWRKCIQGMPINPDRKRVVRIIVGLVALADMEARFNFNEEYCYSAELKLLPLPENPEGLPVNPLYRQKYEELL